MKFNTKSLGAVFALALSFALSNAANANLVTNGSFELPDIPDNTWSAQNPSNVPGWMAAPATIEIWDSLNGVASAEGEQHAELNSHNGQGPFHLWQSIATTIGQSYSFSFAYRARNASAGEQFEAALLNGNISSLSDFTGASQIYNSGTINNNSATWAYLTVGFTAVNDFTTVAFKSINPVGIRGNFIDDVSVVSAPATLGLFGLALAGFFAARRK
jgi:hypothetical protein